MSESNFETELRNLRPARPSPFLEQAIAAELESPLRTLAVRTSGELVVRAQPNRWAKFSARLGWTLGGAALAALAISLLTPGTASRTARNTNYAGTAGAVANNTPFETVASVRELISREASAIVYDEENGPSQNVRYTSVEHHFWANPATGATLEIEVPREDVVLVPVSYQ